MDLKKPLTFDEQLDKLIAHGICLFLICLSYTVLCIIQKKMLSLVWLVLERIH